MTEIKKPKKELSFVQSNALVDAIHSMELNEGKLFLALLAMVEPNEPITDEKLYSLAVQSYGDLLEVEKSALYEGVVSAAQGLRGKPIKLLQDTNGEKLLEVIETSFFQEIRYSKKKGTVRVRFSKAILPYISQFHGNWTLLLFRNIAHMRSKYGVRLYQLLMVWLRNGILEIKIDALRERWGLTEKYLDTYNFKRRVITPAIDDVNKYSDLWVKVGYRKEGRILTAIQFQFGMKTERIIKEKKKTITKREAEKMAKPGETHEKLYSRLGKEGIYIKQ